MATLDDVDRWMSGRPDADAYVTKALQMSFADNTRSSNPTAAATTTPTISPDVSTVTNLLNFPGSLLDPEANSPIPKPQRHVAGGKAGAGGVSKRRKPRASKKRSQTTFIAADPANFRQMVQQVTGVKVIGGGGGDWGGPPVVVKPAPQRPPGGLLLPTLDTSSFLMGGNVLHRPYPGHVAHQQQQGEEGMIFLEPADGPVGPGGYNGLEAFSGFPTLDSWKVIL